MEHQAVVIGDAQIEQRGLARNDQIKAVFLTRRHKAVCELCAHFAEDLRCVQLFHFIDAGNRRRKRYGAHPIRACVGDARHSGFHMLAAAERGHVVAVGKRLAEADEVCLNAVIVVGALQIQTEACAHVVENQHHAFFVAEFAHRLPIFRRSNLVILEIAVVIRLGNQTRDVAVTGIVGILQRFQIEPRYNHVVCDLFRHNAWVVDFLRPLEVSVIEAL